MVKDTDLGNTSTATITTQRAQQILQSYQAYKQNGGQPAPAAVPKPTPSPSSSSNPNQIQISQANLNRSNYLRAQQDLPPLQEVANVRVVQPTRTSYSSPTSGPQPEKIVTQAKQEPTLAATPAQKNTPDVRAQYEQALSTLKPSGGGGEAVSFLRFPFSPNKGSTSNNIQSTTILDPLQFTVGGAGRVIKTGGEALIGILRPQAKTISKVGASDIGLNIKPSEAFIKAKSFESQASRLPPPASAKPTSPPKTPRVPTSPSGGGPSFTSTNVNLGKGLGRMIPKNSGGGILSSDVFKPSSSPPPSPPKPAGKEVSAGKGLVQLVREKPQIEKPQITQEQKVIPEKPKLLQKQKQEPILKQKQKQEQILQPKIKQTQTQRFKPKPRQKQRLIFVPLIPQGKQPPKQIPTLVPGQPQKQKQGGGMPIPTPPITVTPTMLIPPPTRNTPPPTIPPPIRNPPPTEQPPPTKRPPPFVGLLNPQSGALGKVGKGGSRKGFTGNVPLTSIVGIYNRSEISYGNVKQPKLPKTTKQKSKSYRL